MFAFLKGSSKIHAKNPKTIKYKDIFYGKKRIMFVLLLIFGFIVFSAISLLVKLAELTKTTFVVDKISYSSKNASKMNVIFRLKDYKSPIRFSISKIQVRFGDNIKTTAEAIEVKKKQDFIINCNLNMEKCFCENFDYKNFKLTVECKLKVHFLLIPYIFIINYNKNLNLRSRGKTDRSWYNEIELNSVVNRNKNWESCVSSVNKRKFFESVFPQSTEIDIEFDDLHMFFKPDVFSLVTFKGFKYNSKEKEGLLSMEFIRDYDNRSFQTFLLKFLANEQHLILDRFEQNGKVHKIMFDPLHRIKTEIEPFFSQPWVALKKLKLQEKISFSMEFAEDSFCDFLYMCCYFFMKNHVVFFEGRQNKDLVLKGTATLLERGAQVEFEIYDFNVFFRFCIYTEPRMSFEIVNPDHFMLSLIEDVKFITNLFKNYSVYYKNNVTNVNESQIDFSKSFLVEHKIKQKGPSDNLNQVEITSTCKFRDINDLDREDLSEYALLDLCEDIEFFPMASRFSGFGAIKKGEFFLKNAEDSTSNKMFGTYIQVATLIFNQDALEILNNKGVDAIFNLFGSGFGFQFKNGRVFDIQKLLTGPDEYGFIDYATTDNYNDKSIFIDNDNIRDDPDVKFGKFALQLKENLHILNLKTILSTAKNCMFKDFKKRMFPNDNQKMIFEQIMYFEPMHTTIACKKNDKLQKFCDLSIVKSAQMNFTFIDGYFYLDMPKPTEVSINFFDEFLNAEDIIFQVKDGCWLGAIIGNFTKVQVGRDDTPICKKWMADWSNFGMNLDFKITEDSLLDVIFKFYIPQELIDTAESIEFIDFMPFKIKGISTVENEIFDIYVSYKSSKDKTFILEVLLKFNMNIKTHIDAIDIKIIYSYGAFSAKSFDTNTAMFFSALYVKNLSTWEEFEQHCVRNIPKFVGLSLDGEKSDLENEDGQSLKIEAKFYIDMDMFVCDFASKIAEFIKSKFFAPTFFLKYNFENLAIIEIFYKNKLFLKAGKLKSDGTFSYPLAYSSVMYDITPLPGHDAEQFYDCPFILHKAFFAKDSEEHYIYFIDRNIENCQKICCNPLREEKYIIKEIQQHTAKILDLEFIYYKYHNFKGKDTTGNKTVDTFFNPHIESCAGKMDAEVTVYNSLGSDIKLDPKQFSIKSPLCLGFTKLQNLMVEKKVSTSIIFCLFADLDGGFQINIACPFLFMIDEVKSKIWCTAIASLGTNLFVMVDFRDRFDDPELNLIGHNFAINVYAATPKKNPIIDKFKKVRPNLSKNAFIWISTNKCNLLVDFKHHFDIDDNKINTALYLVSEHNMIYWITQTLNYTNYRFYDSIYGLVHDRYEYGLNREDFRYKIPIYGDLKESFKDRAVILPNATKLIKKKREIFERCMETIILENR